MTRFPEVPRCPGERNVAGAGRRPKRMSSPSLAIALLALSACAACSGPSYEPRAATAPTVAGSTPAPYADFQAAKAAFARTDGPLTAVLEDAAWIRLEPDPAQAEARHADYAAGLTAFEVTLETDGFVRPTDETYVLTDSTGRSVSSKPTSYRGGASPSGRRQVATFTISFPHVLTKDLEWIRLTRQGAGGGVVQWDLRAPPAAPSR
jgi:hypothetical protein